MESSLTSFTPLGLTLGILLMSSTTLSVLPLRKSIMFLSVLMISFSPLLMLYSNLMLFLGSLAWCLYLLIFLKFGLFLGLFQRVCLERVVLSVPRREIFSLPLVSRFHCAVESAVPLSGCYVVDVYVGDLIYCVSMSSLLLFLLFLMTLDCLDSWSILTAWSMAS